MVLVGLICWLVSDCVQFAGGRGTGDLWKEPERSQKVELATAPPAQATCGGELHHSPHWLLGDEAKNSNKIGPKRSQKVATLCW